MSSSSYSQNLVPNVLSHSPFSDRKRKRPIEEVINGPEYPVSDESSNATSMKRSATGKGPRRIMSPSECNDRSGPYSCSECHKSFDKSKALCGRMRSHAPPRNVKEEALVVGSTKIRPTGEEKEVAASLMLLAKGKEKVDEKYSFEPRMEKEKEKEKMEEGKEKKELKTKHYNCLVCKKVFNSKQALGGHRASHRLVKGCCVKGGGESSSTRAKNKEEGEMKEYKCDLCIRKFKNASGLATHKKIHAIKLKIINRNKEYYNNLKQGKFPPPPPPPTLDAVAIRIEYEFDLNQPPYPEDEEEEDHP